jgi:prepilin-type N-terminal cleavage/methylation domain-containing protein
MDRYIKTQNNNGFTLIEMMMVILIIGIILSLSIPNYGLVRERARVTAQKMNMYNVGTVIESYFSEKGEYGYDFYEDGYGAYFPGGDPYANPEPVMGKLPTNPWTGEELIEDNFNPDWPYDYASEVSSDSVGGANDLYDYELEPGEMRYGMYQPVGSVRITLWGLIGMDGKGQSIRSFDATGERVIIFVLHN